MSHGSVGVHAKSAARFLEEFGGQTVATFSALDLQRRTRRRW